MFELLVEDDGGGGGNGGYGVPVATNYRALTPSVAAATAAATAAAADGYSPPGNVQESLVLTEQYMQSYARGNRGGVTRSVWVASIMRRTCYRLTTDTGTWDVFDRG